MTTERVTPEKGTTSGTTPWERPKERSFSFPSAEPTNGTGTSNTSLAGPDSGTTSGTTSGNETNPRLSEQARAARPIVKWVGGKTKLLPELLARCPAKFGRYYEPFAGGAALFFALQPEQAVIGDANADLIAMYEQVASRVEVVIDLLEVHRTQHSEAHYYETREQFNARAMLLSELAAAFIYLNKTCFNGLWRVNKSGRFNVPIGDYKNPTIVDADALRAAAGALATCTLQAGDYRACVHSARAGDFIYFDPPYDETFNAYTPDAFDQVILAETARELAARGCHVMVSNSDTPRIRALYADFDLEVVRNARSVNSDGAGRGDVDELIITNRPRRNDATAPIRDERDNSAAAAAANGSRDAVLCVRPSAAGDAGDLETVLPTRRADDDAAAAQSRAHQDAQQTARSEGLRGPRGDREVMERPMTRPPEQQYFDGMAPADEPNVEEVKQAIYLWLDAKVSQKRAAEETKQKHAQMLTTLAENELDWHPYLDPFTQKKKRVFITKEPKAKTTSVPKPPGEKKRSKRGGPSRDIDADLGDEPEETEDNKVESRRVPRSTVAREIDPFGSTRNSMKGGVLDQVETEQGSDKPIPEIGARPGPKGKRNKKPSKPKRKKGK